LVALVHGHVPREWQTGVTVQLPVDAMRRWKKKPKTNDTTTRSMHSAKLVVLEQTTGQPALSTIMIHTNLTTPGIAGTVSYYLRKVTNHAVVGDRFAGQEYLTLPRYMRNRIKQKVCLGCIRVETATFSTQVPLPSKWSASYWQEQLTLGNKED
jgi:hypothetical protein